MIGRTISHYTITARLSEGTLERVFFLTPF
jgi:hypothetical protein